MAKVSMFWHGSPLSKTHTAAISSFIKNKHQVRLYLYDHSIAVPKGVEVFDANHILKKNEIFVYLGSMAGFSDVFRYHLIKSTGETWVDADTFCFSEFFFEDREYLFIKERDDIYAGGILKLPQGGAEVDFLIKKSYKIKKQILKEQDTKWASLGPDLITQMAKNFRLEDYAIGHKQISMIDFHSEDPIDLWTNPAHRDEMIQRSVSSNSATFFNSYMKKNNISLDNIVKGSAMEYFVDLYY